MTTNELVSGRTPFEVVDPMSPAGGDGDGAGVGDGDQAPRAVVTDRRAVEGSGGDELVPDGGAGIVVSTARRREELDQAAELLVRHLRSCAATRGGPPPADDELARFRYPGRWSRLLLARRDGEPVGAARVRWSPGRRAGEVRCGQLSHLVVEPDARRHGVGEALVRRAASVAWWTGCRDIEVGPGAASREATPLYERVGFRPGPADEGLVLLLDPRVVADLQR